MNDRNPLQLWFVTGSQHLYGPEALARVAANSQQIAQALDHEAAIPCEVVFKPVMTTPEEIRNLCRDANSSPECAGLILWMHTFSPRQDVDRGAQVAEQAVPAPPYPVQSRTALRDHRHGLYGI